MMHHRELFQNNKSENVSQNYCPDVVKSCFVPRLHKDVCPQAPQPTLRFSQDPGFYQKKVFWEAGGKSQSMPAIFSTPNSFGTVPGYATNLGVIVVPQDNMFNVYT